MSNNNNNDNNNNNNNDNNNNINIINNKQNLFKYYKIQSRHDYQADNENYYNSYSSSNYERITTSEKQSAQNNNNYNDDEIEKRQIEMAIKASLNIMESADEIESQNIIMKVGTTQ